MALSLRTRTALKWLLLLAVVLGLASGSYEALHWYTHVYEFDARIRTDLTRISSRVNGTVEEIVVREGDRVAAGDLLATMKTGMVRQRIVALQADLAAAMARRAKLVAEKQGLEIGLDARLATKRAQLHALDVEREALADRHELAKKKFERMQFLVSRNLTSQQVLEDQQDRVLDLAGQVRVAAARVQVAKHEVAEIEAGRAEIAVFDEDIHIVESDARRFAALVKEREVDLADRTIRSPISGVVDKIFKNKGEYVEDADELLIIHDPANIWVEANISEDQVRHLRVGQPVKVELDAYPYRSFRGEVARIGMVTVADLALPGASVSAKSLKAVQRIPVKIRLLDLPELAAPGMLVEVNIQIHDPVRVQ